MSYASTNPFDGKTVKTFHELDDKQLGDMGIQEFVNKKLVRVASMAAPV